MTLGIEVFLRQYVFWSMETVSSGHFCTPVVHFQACVMTSYTKVNELSLCGSGGLGSAWPSELSVCGGFHSSRTLTLGECQFPLWIPGNGLPSPFSELL